MITHETTLGQRRYRRYLALPEWQARRRMFLAAHPACADCGVTATQVHHRSYERVGDERDDDLEGLCGGCHRARHDETP